jgi:hypothetical protein
MRVAHQTMKFAPAVVVCLLLLKALASSELVTERSPLSLIMPVVMAAERQSHSLAGETTASEPPISPSAVTTGMKKEQVHALWGEPIEVRQTRTCFGTREEWVYRGNPQRYGSEERTLLFDEADVLEEMK